MDDLLVHGVTSVERSGIIGEVTGKSDGQLGGRGDIDVDVGPEGVRLLVDIVVE